MALSNHDEDPVLDGWESHYQWLISHSVSSVAEYEIPMGDDYRMFMKMCVLGREDRGGALRWKIFMLPLHFSSRVLASDELLSAYFIDILSRIGRLDESGDRDRMVRDLVSICRSDTARGLRRRISPSGVVTVLDSLHIVMLIREEHGAEAEGESGSNLWSRGEPHLSGHRYAAADDRRASTGKLEKMKYKCNPSSSSVDEGVICLEKFEKCVEVSRMPCLHIFHSYCIHKWLQNTPSCPCCRFRLVA